MGSSLRKLASNFFQIREREREREKLQVEDDMKLSLEDLARFLRVLNGFQIIERELIQVEKNMQLSS